MSRLKCAPLSPFNTTWSISSFKSTIFVKTTGIVFLLLSKTTFRLFVSPKSFKPLTFLALNNVSLRTNRFFCEDILFNSVDLSLELHLSETVTKDLRQMIQLDLLWSYIHGTIQHRIECSWVRARVYNMTHQYLIGNALNTNDNKNPSNEINICLLYWRGCH